MNARLSFSTLELLIRRCANDPNPDPSMSYPMRVGRCLHTAPEGKAGLANRAVNGVEATNAMLITVSLKQQKKKRLSRVVVDDEEEQGLKKGLFGGEGSINQIGAV